MTWVKWLLVGLLVLNAMAVAASVGRPRQPITLGRAALASATPLDYCGWHWRVDTAELGRFISDHEPSLVESAR
jgi:uncharacterized membrane protein